MNESFMIITWTRMVELCLLEDMSSQQLVRTPASAARTGTLMALASMSCVQLGIAVSVNLFDDIGPAATAWLRLTFGALLLILVARPWRTRITRSALTGAVFLGLATGGVTLLFVEAVARLPLGTAS